MKLEGSLQEFPRTVKRSLFAFLIALTFGYSVGLYFIGDLMGPTPSGIKENYLGNEENKEVEGAIKFKMSKREILTTVHDHSIAVSLVFFALSFLLFTTSMNSGLKKFLVIEPFISVILTFGGIWVMWMGLEWFKYIIMISGTLMHLSFYTIVGILLVHLFKKRPS